MSNGNANNNLASASNGPKKYGSKVDCPRCGMNCFYLFILIIRVMNFYLNEKGKWYTWLRKWWAVDPVGINPVSPARRATRDSNLPPSANEKAKSIAKVWPQSESNCCDYIYSCTSKQFFITMNHLFDRLLWKAIWAERIWFRTRSRRPSNVWIIMWRVTNIILIK